MKRQVGRGCIGADPRQIHKAHEIVWWTASIGDYARQLDHQRSPPPQPQRADDFEQPVDAFAGERRWFRVLGSEALVDWNDLVSAGSLQQDLSRESEPGGLFTPPGIVGEVPAAPRQQAALNAAPLCWIQLYAESGSLSWSLGPGVRRAGRVSRTDRPRARTISHATVSTSGTTTELPNCL